MKRFVSVDLDPQSKLSIYARVNHLITILMFALKILISTKKKDYLNEWTNLYNELKAYSTDNQVNRFICEILIQQLKSSLAVKSSFHFQS